MFGTRGPYKPVEYREARRLRHGEGMPMKRIAAKLGVSVGTVHAWTHDIEVTPEQRERNLYGTRGPLNAERLAARAEAWRKRSREKRLAYQLEGRERARQGDALHMAGCMLYWAEGAKARTQLALGNSDMQLVRFFCKFLRGCFDLSSDDFTFRLNVYTDNGLSIEEIERYWLEALDLPRSCLRGHTLNHKPTSSSGLKRNKLPYGVCTVKVKKSTWLIQHIYGAIQEYGGFDEPRWLDCDPVR